MNLNQISIKSSDVNRAVKFYQKLGLQLIVDSSPRYVRFEFPSGDCTFSISHSDAFTDKTIVMYFEVKNLDQVYQQLKQQGLHFTSPPEDKDWLWREAHLSDPDGHPLKLFTAGQNRKNPPWRLATKRWYEYICDSPVNLLK